MCEFTLARGCERFWMRLGFPALLFAAMGSVATAGDMRTVQGLANPESVVAGPDGRLYVSEIGEFGKDGDGKITVIGKSGAAEPFAKGFDDPKGLAFSKDVLYVADKMRVWKVDRQGTASVFVKAEDFPQPPLFLNDVAVDRGGNIFVSDTGDLEKGGKGAIFRITPAGKVSVLVSEKQNPAIKSPNGLLFEKSGKLLVVDFATGQLLRLDVGTGAVQKVAEGFGGADGLAQDASGTLYISDWKNGQVWKMNPNRKGAKPQRYEQSFQAAADIGLSPDGKFVLVPDMKAGMLAWLPR